MKRVCALLLAVILLLPTFAGCGLFDRGEKLTLCGGEEAFTVVYNKRTTTAAQAAVLTDAVKQATGAQWNTSYQSQEGRAEVLLGNPASEVAQTVLGNLRNRDFAVGVWGGKYLIVAQTAEKTAAAIDWFVQNVLPSFKNGKLTVREKNNYIFSDQYTLGNVTIGGTPLREYSIVVPDEMPVTAYQTAVVLYAYLKDAAGLDLPVITASQASGRSLIRVGMSDIPSEANGYYVGVKGVTLSVAAQSYFGYLAAQDVLCEQLFRAGEQYDLPHGTKYTGTGGNYVTPQLQGEGAIRVMFHDVQAPDSVGLSTRAELMAMLYAAYAPDVLGLQGVTSAVRSSGVISALEAAGYAEVVSEDVSAANNLTPLFYRTDAFSLSLAGGDTFSNLNYNESYAALGGYTASELKKLAATQNCGVSWALLTEAVTNRSVLIVSVKLFETAEDAAGQSTAIRTTQMRRVLQLIATARADNLIPVDTPCLLGGNWGDTDALPDHEGAYEDLDVLAEAAGVSRIAHATAHAAAVYDPYAENYLTIPQKATASYAASADRMFLNTPATVTVAGMYTVDDGYARLAAPHDPVFADVVLTDAVPVIGADAPVQTLTIGGSKISEYVIVAPASSSASEWRTAVLLRERIKLLTGTTLKIVQTPNSTQTKQIRIGQAMVQTATATAAHSWTVRVDGTVMEIVAESYYGYFAVQDYLSQKLFIVKEPLVIADGMSAHGASDAGAIAEMEKEGQVRLMFNNIYGGSEYNSAANKDEGYDTAQRMAMLAEVYTEYMPDVLGLQEYHQGVRSALNPRLKALGYVEVNIASYSRYPSQTFSPNTKKNSAVMNTTTNSTPIYYLPSTVELLDYGYFWYGDIDYANSVYATLLGGYTAEQVRGVTVGDYSKGFTWAIFRVKSTGAMFMFASTHLWWKGEAVDDACRCVQFCYAKEFLLLQADAWLAANDPTAAQGSLPIFYGGDYNSAEARVSHKLMNSVTPVQSTALADRDVVFENLNYLSVGQTIVGTTHHAYGHYNKTLKIYDRPQYTTSAYRYSIDYVFTNRSAESHVVVKKMCRVADDYAYLTSDHFPIFADVDLLP